ncbi:glutamate receptor 3.1-like isoform X2 [Phalaenopsis equestris]|uniref:glutamate receptor 3.1-like isoform X2 n=1 Tax=Phalaenopsis equestris TaxID=78828 RepID=UPI0009E5C33A|nr:glutamate receptor 3.1-like isoform X2 [Phalaenopsis equestris]
MKLVLLIFLFICSYLWETGVCKNNYSRPATVNIGAILALNSTIGRVARVAINVAVKDVNSDPSVLRGTRLVVHQQDSNCNAFVAIVQVLQFMETDIVAIIGPQSSVVAHVVTHVANELKVPMLSFSATDPTLSSLQYPFFVRTTQSDKFQMAAIADLVDYFQWREVIVIFVDDDYGRNGVAALSDELAERNYKISYKAALPPEPERSRISDLLVKVALMESRVIILHTNPDSGIKVLSVAHYLGMMIKGYAWIATDWLSSLLDSSSPLNSEIMLTMEGVLSLRQHTADTERKKSLLSKWSKFENDDKAVNFRLNSYGLYAYDSVWMVAHALDTFFDDGGAISFYNDSRLEDVDDGVLNLEALSVFGEGNLLLEKIKSSVFDGVTGHFQLDSDGNIIHPAYDILNIVGTGSRSIGYWSNYSGLSTETPEILYLKPPNRSSINQKLYDVIWPGQTAIKPRGWVFPNNGLELRIGVPNRHSFPEFVSKDRGSDTMKGYCIDVFTAAINLLPYPVAYRFIPFGIGSVNPNYTELVEKVQANDFDAAVGDIAITMDRARIADFTQPFIEAGLVILTSVKERESSAWAFLQPFTVEMWCVTGLFFIFVGAVIWILEHRINDEFRGPPRKQIITIFWFSFSTLFFAHREPTVSTLGRLVLIIWLFVVFIVQSSYTASLTSILTVRQLTSPITGIDTIINSNDPIGYQVGSFAEKYLIEELRISSSRLRVLHNLDEYVRALELGPSRGGVVAVVDERPYIELFLSIKCNFALAGSEFMRIGWGFAFQRDSPLAVDMSSAILKLSENGDLQRIHDKWLMRSSCNSDKSEIESNSLQLQSFWGLFAICGVACFLALLIYFVMIIHQFLRHFTQESLKTPEGSSRSGGSKSGRILQSFLSFADEKEVDPRTRSRSRQCLSETGNAIDVGSETSTPRK